MPEYLAPGVFVEEIDSGSKPIEGVGTNTTAFIGYAKSGVFNTPIFISNWTQFCEEFGEDEGIILPALSTELGKPAVELLAKKRAQKPKKNWMAFAQQELKAAGKDFAKFLKDHKVPQASVPYLDGSYLAHAVKGYYDNGGGRAYIVRIPRKVDTELFSSGGAKQIAAQPAKREICGYTVKAIAGGSQGNEIKLELEPVGEGDEFRIKISSGAKEEQFGFGKDKPLTPGGFAAAVNGKSKLVTVDEAAVATATRPAEAITINLEGGVDAQAGGTELAVRTPAVADLAGLEPDNFVGDEARRTGASGLALVEDVNMVCMPDLMAGLWQRDEATGDEMLVLDEKRRQAILDMQCLLAAYCERSGDRMAILDPLPGQTPAEMMNTTMSTPYNSDHGQAVIYYPWVKIPDPTDRDRKRQMFVPPSGHVAGVWVRAANERGVHKAPANEAMLGVVALETTVTKGEQEILNPIGVNCIRSFPGTGIRIWGARTLATVGNPSWKYVNVRRLFNYLEKSMERGLQWVVFEPNDADLWGRVRRNLSAFLWTEWKEGKLFGSTPAEAFYVKCDAETNPQEMIDLGRLYVEIGVNPVKPAEFVIVRIGQWSGASNVSEG
ncbi:MAG: phage tail sheath family protein [Armatimonadota bacterium]